MNLHWWICLTYWGRVTHICVNRLTIIGSGNGLSPGRRQVIIWTNDFTLVIRPLRTNFCAILIAIFILMKIRFKTPSGKWRPFFLSLNVLNMSQSTSPCIGKQHYAYIYVVHPLAIETSCDRVHYYGRRDQQWAFIRGLPNWNRSAPLVVCCTITN